VNAYEKEIKQHGGLTSWVRLLNLSGWLWRDEIAGWKNFRNALASDEEKEAFDQIMDMCRDLASAGSCACSPIILEPMAMSILVAQQKKKQRLENELNDLLRQRS